MWLLDGCLKLALCSYSLLCYIIDRFVNLVDFAEYLLLFLKELLLLSLYFWWFILLSWEVLSNDLKTLFCFAQLLRTVLGSSQGWLSRRILNWGVAVCFLWSYFWQGTCHSSSLLAVLSLIPARLNYSFVGHDDCFVFWWFVRWDRIRIFSVRCASIHFTILEEVYLLLRLESTCSAQSRVTIIVRAIDKIVVKPVHVVSCTLTCKKVLISKS